MVGMIKMNRKKELKINKAGSHTTVTPSKQNANPNMIIELKKQWSEFGETSQMCLLFVSRASKI